MELAMKTLALRFTAIIGLVAMASGAIADGKDDNGSQTLEGTWMSKVTTPNPPPGAPATFLSMATYTASGQVVEENNTTQMRSVGQGEWARTGNNKFVRTITIFGFATGRVFASFTKVTSSIQLARDGESYTAINSFDMYDANGVLLVSGQNTSVAKRCGLGDTIPQCVPA